MNTNTVGFDPFTIATMAMPLLTSAINKPQAQKQDPLKAFMQLQQAQAQNRPVTIKPPPTPVSRSVSPPPPPPQVTSRSAGINPSGGMDQKTMIMIGGAVAGLGIIYMMNQKGNKRR